MAQEKSPQELLVKAKLYRFVSLLFITIGILIFCVMYVENVEGRLFEALKNPMTIAIFLIPFLPAAVLSLMADSAEKKYKALISQVSQTKK